MRLRLLAFALCLSACVARAQQAPASTEPLDNSIAPPLPDIATLLRQVEANQHTAEAIRSRYTYHVAFQSIEVDRNGKAKKSETSDYESLAIDGIRINRLVAKDGKPLSPDEARKENERIDKDVAKLKAQRADLSSQGKASNERGQGEISVARFLELGSFTNLRIAELDGRRSFVVDFTGDPQAKTHNVLEGAVKDLAGVIWIDDQDRVLVRGEGHFVRDFKIGGGLVADMHQGSNLQFSQTKVDGEIWLPSIVDAQGKLSYFLFGGINGSMHMRASEYKKFRTSAVIREGSHEIGPDGQPLPDPPAEAPKP